MTSQTLPSQAAGLYDPRFEHDSCGVAFVARLNAVPTHETLERALTALENLEHRGAAAPTRSPATAPGSSPAPRRVLPRASLGDELPPAGQLRRRDVLPAARRRERRAELEQLLERHGRGRGAARRLLARRAGRLDAGRRHRRGVAPVIRQLFVGARPDAARPGRLRAQALRDPARVAELAAPGPDLVIPSFSSRRSSTRGC